MEYGYARVSTKEQNELRQLIALRDGEICLLRPDELEEMLYA